MYYNGLPGNVIKPFYLNYKDVDYIYRLVIKYCEFIGRFNGENNLQFIIDAETWKHGYRKGLDTLLVRALNDEY